MAIKLGTTGDDTVIGTAGWDTLHGLLGNDVLFGDTGNDILSGDEGNDTLEGGAGADSLNGEAGADVFKYTDFNDAKGDKIIDFSAEDSLDFSAIANAKFIGNAQFNGVAGEIRYFNSAGSLSPLMANNSGSTYLSIDTNGDAQEDISLYFSGSALNFTETSSNSKILMAAPNQTINGTGAEVSLLGGAGNDTIIGGTGNVYLFGGEGNDVLQGGEGNNDLYGGLGIDTLTGGSGADTFRFGSSDDFALNNSPYYYGRASDVITDFGIGDKIIFNFQGMKFINDAPFSGSSGQYRFGTILNSDGNNGNGLIFDFDGDKNTDAQISFLSMDLPSLGVLKETTAATFSTLEIVPNKTLQGTNANETLKGGIAHDIIIGNRGNDRLVGFEGNDSLDGGNGNDTLVGGLGNDTLTGGLNNDVFTYKFITDFSGDTITDLAVGDRINLSAFAGLSFIGSNNFSGIANQIRFADNQLQIDSNGDYSSDYILNIKGNVLLEESAAGSNIFQTYENKMILGTNRNDVLNGGRGNDTLSGGDGNDVLKSGMRNDSLEGGLGNDFLNGFYGNDTLTGGDGSDTLVGSFGSDILTGGAGNDGFRFSSLAELTDGQDIYSNFDVITDFTKGDKINLAGVDANILLAGNQAFSFVGSAGFSGVAGQLQYQSGSLTGDVNGDRIADFYIALTGSPTLTAASFVL